MVARDMHAQKKIGSFGVCNGLHGVEEATYYVHRRYRRSVLSGAKNAIQLNKLMLVAS